MVKAVPAFEILMHRMVWSFLLLVPIVLIQGRWSDFKAALSSRRAMAILLVSTTVVGFNWFCFIWAINHDKVLQTSLGYYINPLINVLLGVVFLHERLRRLQLFAVGLAAAGVLNLVLSLGELPWVSLALAISFGIYGLIRKVAPVGAVTGLAVETMLLSFPAVAYLAVLASNGNGAFAAAGWRITLLLPCAALVTAIPLILFTRGARRLHLSTIGFLQYIAPTCTFVLAVFLWREPLEPSRLTTFGLIWTALAVYSADSVQWHRKQRGRQTR
jgi:chloramphenicol-sensitive protein RarD